MVILQFKLILITYSIYQEDIKLVSEVVNCLQHVFLYVLDSVASVTFFFKIPCFICNDTLVEVEAVWSKVLLVFVRLSLYIK